MQMGCTTTTTSQSGTSTSTSVGAFTVATAMPAWTDPGSGTPFRIGVTPDPVPIGSGPWIATVSAVGVEGDLVFPSFSTAPRLVVTAARGEEVVITLESVDNSAIFPHGPGGGPIQVVTRCVPYSGEDPVVGRVPVREASPATTTEGT
jgi:hypothetical protein